MLRVASYNVNGIRAAVRRGYTGWVADRTPDVICLQEVRAPEDAVPPEAIDGYHVAYHAGDRAGRNGVAVLTRAEPTEVRVGFGSAEFDAQGRYLEVDLPSLTVASLYLPKGDVYGDKYEAKMRFMTEFSAHVEASRKRASAAGRPYLVCGDFNIARAEADIKAWKRNLKSEGFLPEERQWVADMLASGHLVDVVREKHPDRDGPYSWWSWRGKAFDNDAGWRIDYHWATADLADLAVTAEVDRAPSYAERVSDHAPVVVDYRL